MNKTIKTVSLALLLCTATAYCMDKSVIITIPSEPFTINNIVIPDDNLKQIVKYAFSDDTRFSEKTINIANKIRSVCKYLYTTFHLVAIRQLLNWDPKSMPGNLFLVLTEYNDDSERNNKLTSLHKSWHIPLLKIQQQLDTSNNKNHFCDYSSFYDICNNANNYHRFTFFADAIKDQPNLYDKILNQAISRNLPTYMKILLERGANPNFYEATQKKTHLKMAAHNMEMFQLLLQYGGNVYQNSGNGQTIMDIALENAMRGDDNMIKMILQKTKNIPSQYQRRINKYRSAKIKKTETSTLFPIYLLRPIYLMPLYTLSMVYSFLLYLMKILR